MNLGEEDCMHPRLAEGAGGGGGVGGSVFYIGWCGGKVGWSSLPDRDEVHLYDGDCIHRLES